ncbi:hypothetical protein PGB90_009438 [Kerria lacca]
MAMTKCEKIDFDSWVFVFRIRSVSYILLIFLSLFDYTKASEIRYGPCCDNAIYCHGRLLHTIQMSGIHTDSKTFVDMKIKTSEEDVLKKFDEMMNETGNTPTKAQIQEFVKNNFDREGSEFSAWDPLDWKPSPKFLSKIKDPKFKDWAGHLHLLWKFLGRKIKEDVHNNPSLYSIIYVPNPVIVPGGRFREFYYWDSYWIIKGLLLSEMIDTVRGMIENFLHIVDVYGHIPNGGRIYYLMRSQAPLLSPMIQLYYDHTKDLEFVRKNIHLMEKEFQFWMNNRTVQIEKDGKHYTLARYKERSTGPRPESYREDYETGMVFSDEEDKNNFYSELKSAAESGWDFSTRWFIVNGTNKGNLTNIKTSYIVPVDLNAFLFWDAQIISNFYKELNHAPKAMHYENVSSEWLLAVEQILWHEEVGAWLDYDLMNEVKRDYFYPTNIVPLWTGCFHKEKTEYYVSKVLKYLERTQVMNNLGGIPTTLEHSGEQWDFPNAWPPLQHMMIMGLDSTGDSWAQDLAYEIAVRWTRSNWLAYNKTNTMMEKYDASVPGGHGGGGEYEVQMGFGWTNGVILELLNKYGDKISLTDDFESEESKIMSNGRRIINVHLQNILASLVALIIRFTL